MPGRGAAATVTIVDRVTTAWVEEPWPRFLLGDLAGETVRDPGGEVVVPGSVIVTQRPDLLSEEQLSRVASTPHVGLFHISDEWYRRPLGAYRAFSWVWRQHLHSGLRAEGVRALPLGPVSTGEIDVGLHAASATPLVERAHPVTFVGKLVTTRFAAVEALSGIAGALVVPTGRFAPGTGFRPPEYAAILRSSALVACPMGNVHLESFRVYEALEAGAVPIVERRRGLDYFALLLGDHPLPNVRAWRDAPALVRELRREAALRDLQEATREWWRRHKEELRRAVQADAASTGDRRVRVMRGGGRLAGARELARHHNATAWARRAQLTALRLGRR